MSRFTGFGEGLADGGTELTIDAQQRTVDVLREYRSFLDTTVLAPPMINGVQQPRLRMRMHAVATAAARSVKNCDSFLSAAQGALRGFRPNVISGEEEARLSFLRAISRLDPGTGSFLVVDIGGCSTELAFGPGADRDPAGQDAAGSWESRYDCQTGQSVGKKVQDGRPRPTVAVRWSASSQLEAIGRPLELVVPPAAATGPCYVRGQLVVPRSNRWSNCNGSYPKPSSGITEELRACHLAVPVGPTAIDSVEVGVVRLTERFLKSDPPIAEELRACHLAALHAFRQAIRRQPVLAHARTVVCVPDAARTLVSMAMKMAAGHHRPSGQLPKLTRRSVHRILDIVKGIPAADRVGLPGLPKGRETVIVAGCVIVLALMEALGTNTWLASDSDILDGIIFDIQSRRRVSDGTFSY
ncbi:hypothetical protein CBR_g1064 [Chara braunii]|uniref:Ppx/GppA phosphatase N-terminal domain-containing protein n=1 Tax=Chara braunii TaxID=69332 RepID=A0A388KD14_CHABU|nr:hypothetical protein CBR_g1064 [Chara braunii]|eukprot:GBG67945.1 hypothetical protein CBR_g1064 [Chara braunii]